MSDSSSIENDLRAIEAINQREVQASLTGDPALLMSQWTDDFVLLQPVGPILRGRNSIADAFRGVETRVEVLEAGFDIQEVKVLGDWAFQWGTYHQSLRPRAGGEAARSSGKLMRILQRQPDGSWKMSRNIATIDPTTP
jgi:uncharacterized protein (TIGR02246 family)